MSYFPSQTVSTCNKSRHLRERGKEAVRCCLLASQQATEMIPVRHLFYTLLGAKLSLFETWAQSWMTARGQWSRYLAPPLWKLPAKGRSHMGRSHGWLHRGKGAVMWLLPFAGSFQRGGATYLLNCPRAVIHDCANVSQSDNLAPKRV